MATVTGTNRGEALLGRRGVNDDKINNETILGHGGDDILYGLGGDDLLMGGAGDDKYRFDVGDGRDVVTDLEGMNSLYFVSTTSTSFAELTSSNFSSSGSDLVISFTSASTSQQVTLTDYYLSPSSFTIFYNTSYLGSLTEVSRDLLPGSESNPFLATADADTFVGSTDFDWVSYEGSTAGVSVRLDNNPNFGNYSGGDRFTDINNIIGSDYADSLRGTTEDNVLRGGGGNDTLISYAGDDHLYGGAGRDRLYGYSGDDYLYGGAGDDELIGYAGDDHLYGGAGNDGLQGGAGNDHMDGGAGDDSLRGLTGDDYLNGGAGADRYLFSTSGGTDTIEDRAGDTMTLHFDAFNREVRYASADFVEDSNNFNRVGNDLVISIDKDSDDGITNKVTILAAYDSDSSTGIGNAAFTINIEYREGNEQRFTEITEGFWHFLA